MGKLQDHKTNISTCFRVNQQTWGSFQGTYREISYCLLFHLPSVSQTIFIYEKDVNYTIVLNRKLLLNRM